MAISHVIQTNKSMFQIVLEHIGGPSEVKLPKDHIEEPSEIKLFENHIEGPSESRLPII